MCPVTVACCAFLYQQLGESRIEFSSSIGVSFCLTLFMRCKQNKTLCYGLRMGLHGLDLTHVEANFIFTSDSFRTSDVLAEPSQ